MSAENRGFFVSFFSFMRFFFSRKKKKGKGEELGNGVDECFGKCTEVHSECGEVWEETSCSATVLQSDHSVPPGHAEARCVDPFRSLSCCSLVVWIE